MNALGAMLSQGHFRLAMKKPATATIAPAPGSHEDQGQDRGDLRDTPLDPRDGRWVEPFRGRSVLSTTSFSDGNHALDTGHEFGRAR